MNILVVSSILPYPLDHGCKIRMFNLFKYLSKKHNISLACYADSGNQQNYVSRMREYCEMVELVQTKRRSKLRQMPGLTKDLISGLPWQVKYAKSIEMKATLRNLINAKHFDVIHFDDPFMTSNLDFLSTGGAKKVVTFHNIESIKYRRIFKIEKRIYDKLKAFLNLLSIPRFENEIANKSDLIIVVSSVDRQTLKSKCPQVRIAVIQNGVDTDSLKPLTVNEEEDNISFFGTLDYPPNRDAALYFYKQIFPLIRNKSPEAKFSIVGQNPDKELMKLSSDPNIIVTGRVEDVVPYYQRTSVVVVPLRAGGGTRGKILEAMGLGRPVVSTSLGAEGLEVIHKENIMIADKPEDFANYAIELMRNGSLKTALTERARKFVESQHSWRNIADKLDRAYQETCLGR